MYVSMSPAISVRQILRAPPSISEECLLNCFYVNREQESLDAYIVSSCKRFLYVTKCGITKSVNFPLAVVGCCGSYVNCSLQLFTVDCGGNLYRLKVCNSRENISDGLNEKRCKEKSSHTDAIDLTAPVKCLNIDGACDIIMLNKTLLVYVKTSDDVHIRIYNCEKLLCNVESNLENCEPILQRTERMLYRSNLSVTDDKSQCFSSKEHFYVVMSSSQSKCLATGLVTHRILTISDSLFNSIFGIEMNLSNSPVLLILECYGKVYWRPLKFTTGDVNRTVRLLCELGQDIIYVFAFSNSANCSSSLDFVSTEGLIFHLTCNKSREQGNYSGMFSIQPCPFSLVAVTCATIFCNHLVYGTREDLCCVDVECLQNEETASDECLKKFYSLNMQNIIALTSSEKDARHSCLYARSSSGHIYEIDQLNISALKSSARSTIPDFSAHLTALGQQCDQLSSLSKQNLDLSSCIQQLSLFSHIATANQNGISNKSAAENTVKTSPCDDKNIVVDIKGQPFSGRFNVEVTNRTGTVLCKGWMAVVHTHNQNVSDDSSESSLIDLSHMKHNEVRIVSFPLLSDVPVFINVTLILSTEHLLSRSGCDSSLVVTSLRTEQLDCLHLLQRCKDFNRKQIFYSSKNKNSVSDIVQSIAACRRGAQCLNNPDNMIQQMAPVVNSINLHQMASKTNPQVFTFINSSNTFTLLLQPVLSYLNCCSPSSQFKGLLRELFPDDSYPGEEMSLRYSSSDGRIVVISLTENSDVIKLCLSGSCLSLLSQIHSAVTNRIKNSTHWRILPLTNAVKSNHGRKKTLQELEGRLRNLDDEETEEKSDRFLELLKIYKSLRTVPQNS